MANLNAWQKIDRVLPGRPFGDGRDGAYTSTSVPTVTYKSCSGSASSTTLTIASSGFANGDVVLIHQTRGTGAGQWEVNRINSGGNSTSLTMQTALHYTYTDSGASQAQVIKIPMYSSMSVASGTWSPTDWNQDVGGIFPIACNGLATLVNTVELDGGNGTSFVSSGARAGRGTGGGFYGGNGYNGNGDDGPANQGEGTAGAGTYSRLANGNGGGAGGVAGVGGDDGGGGGYATAGANAVDINKGGLGGEAYESADLVTMVFGGGGGGGSYRYSNTAGGGGSGGGIIALFIKNLVTSSATLRVKGGNGATADGAGGGAAGGSILVVCQTATLGTTRLTAPAGTGGTGAGSGSVGRIAVHHSGTVTGTTTPTFTNVTDGSLYETGGGFIFNLL